MTSSARNVASPPATRPPNGLSAAFGVLSDEWNLLLLRASMAGHTRYSEFRRLLPISHAVLTTRLDRLVAEGLFSRSIYQLLPERSEYILTPKGRAIWPLLLCIWAWERDWVPNHQYATPPIRHTVCGEEMSPLYLCRSCRCEAAPEDVVLRWGPTGGWARSTPQVQTRRRGVAAKRTEGENFYPDTMAVFGNRWSALIVAAAFTGTRRFGDFERDLGVPTLVLSERLAELCRRDLFTQAQIPELPMWSEYRLADKGRALFPILGVLADWAENWTTDEAGPALIRTHEVCGHAFRGVLACSRCNQLLRGSEVEPRAQR